MSLSQEHIQGLKSLVAEVKQIDEGGRTYYRLPALRMPEGCAPAVCDGLLLLEDRGDGYPSRLFFSQKISSPIADQRNWNTNGELIGGCLWYAISWKLDGKSRSPVEVVRELMAVLS